MTQNQIEKNENSRTKRNARYAAVFVFLLIALVAITVWNINSGSANISVGEVIKVLLRRGGDEKVAAIVWRIRLPRIITSAVLGGALALSGFLMQTFFGNPIAGPFVLGISAGSKLFVAITMIVMLNFVSSI